MNTRIWYLIMYAKFGYYFIMLRKFSNLGEIENN